MRYILKSLCQDKITKITSLWPDMYDSILLPIRHSFKVSMFIFDREYVFTLLLLMKAKSWFMHLLIINGWIVGKPILQSQFQIDYKADGGNCACVCVCLYVCLYLHMQTPVLWTGVEGIFK